MTEECADIEDYNEFRETLEEPGEYGEEELDRLKNFYKDNHGEENVELDVKNALEESDGEGLRDIQLMSILSAPENYECGGERVEEDYKIGDRSHSA